MATVLPTITQLADRRLVKVQWALTTADNDGAPITDKLLADYPHLTAMFVAGAWGGATAVIEGGDGTNYLTLSDAQGNAISETADAIEGPVQEVVQALRPRLSVVGVGASVTVTVFARK